MIIQFPDLGEETASNYTNSLPVTLPIHYPEFSFMVYKDNDETTRATRYFTEQGYKHISCMNNWWITHLHEYRTLNFWWKKHKDGKADLAAKRERWSGYAQAKLYPVTVPYLQATGCGFKLGKIPLLNIKWYRYFTLLRMPLVKDINLHHKYWMKKKNFNFLDEGSIASYWINGWPSTQYSEEFERSFWKLNDPKDKLLMVKKEGLY